MKNFLGNASVKDIVVLEDDKPIGPLEQARENLKIFADNLIMQDSLRKMIEWSLVLKDIAHDPEISDLERKQIIEEIKLMETAWCAFADTFHEKGISA